MLLLQGIIRDNPKRHYAETLTLTLTLMITLRDTMITLTLTSRYCTPTAQCTALRLSGTDCPPQGPLEPVLCRAGTYCPDWQTQLPCPQGSYCPTGTSEPIKVSSLFDLCVY